MVKIIRLSGSDSKSIKLDLKDKKIMSILVDDARIPITQLAKKVKLKRETVDYRIKRLIDQKFITGFSPIINFKLLGYSFFEIFILIDEFNKEKDSIIKKLSNLPYVKSILEYSDRWDLKITVIAKNLEEFDIINEEIQKIIGINILEKERSAFVKGYYELSMSELFQPNVKKLEKPIKKNLNFKFDKKDISILKNLSENCRQSTYEIGENVGLSPDAISLRINKMVENGIIEKFSTWFDSSKFPLYWYTFAAQLKNFDHSIEDKIFNLIKNNPKIKSARKTLGKWDVFFSIIAGSHKEIHDSVREIKRALSSSLKNYETWLGYEEPYFTTFPKILEK